MPAAPLKVAPDTVVSFEYRLTDDEGVVVDETDGAPAHYLHGHDNILDGLERALEGAELGEERSGILPAKDAFGEASDRAPHRVSRFALTNDAALNTGTHFFVDEDGAQRDFWVVKVEGDHVLARPEHPLAGQRMRYWARILGVRPSTEREREHGHPL